MQVTVIQSSLNCVSKTIENGEFKKQTALFSAVVQTLQTTHAELCDLINTKKDICLCVGRHKQKKIGEKWHLTTLKKDSAHARTKENFIFTDFLSLDLDKYFDSIEKADSYTIEKIPGLAGVKRVIKPSSSSFIEGVSDGECKLRVFFQVDNAERAIQDIKQSLSKYLNHGFDFSAFTPTALIYIQKTHGCVQQDIDATVIDGKNMCYQYQNEGPMFNDLRTSADRNVTQTFDNITFEKPLKTRSEELYKLYAKSLVEGHTESEIIEIALKGNGKANEQGETWVQGDLARFIQKNGNLAHASNIDDEVLMILRYKLDTGAEARALKRAAKNWGVDSKTLTQAVKTARLELKREKLKHLNLVHFDAQSNPLPTLENLEHILEYHKIIFRYNILMKEFELTGDILNSCSFNEQIVEIVSLLTRYEISTVNTYKLVCALCVKNSYNPFRDFVLSKKWDGVDRVSYLFDTLDIDARGHRYELYKSLVLKWLKTLVLAGTSLTGYSNQGMLVLTGKQGRGKTRWFKSLVPKSEWFSEGDLLNPSNTDSVHRCTKHLLVELGEFDCLNTKIQLAELKAFVTRDSDTYRSPYAYAPVRYPRISTYCATSNLKIILNDSENRRFWIVPINHCTQIETDLQQLYAQIEQDLKISTYLNTSELAALQKSNLQFTSPDVFEELIEQYMEPGDTGKTLTEISIIINRPNLKKWELAQLKNALENTGFETTQGGKRYKIKTKNLWSDECNASQN